MNHSHRRTIAKKATAQQESENEDSQSSTDLDDGKCIRCWSAQATVSTDHLGRDMGEKRYCQRCHEMVTARALKDWRLC